ncbi:OTU protein [Taxawa tesnikishii (nom. ined.)]|nr:OTU protein [Dothideales sp. JES 119]
MEELQAKHRKEARDLQSRKTRKGINDECDALERQLKERQAAELAALDDPDAPAIESDPVAHPDPLEKSEDEEVANRVGGLRIGAGEGEGERNAAPDERLARRAAEQAALAHSAASEAASLPDLKAAERERMLAHQKQRGLVEKEIRADGHCLFSAIADQMRVLEMPLQQQHVLGTAAAGAGADASGVELRDQDQSAAGDGRVEEIAPERPEEGKDVWLAYYRHGFGLGEHYNSLRKEGKS